MSEAEVGPARFDYGAFSFASSRTPGATAEMDPDGTPGGYWRAATGWSASAPGPRRPGMRRRLQHQPGMFGVSP